MFCGVMLMSLLSPWLPLPQAHESELAQRAQTPSREHILGTDHLGRSILARAIKGAKTSLGYALLIVLISMGIGVPIGMYCGLHGGRFDQCLLVLSNIMLTLPSFVLALVMSSLSDQNIWALVVPLIGYMTASIARIARATVTRIRDHAYVVASLWMGHSFWHMFRKHLWPNGRSELLAVGCADFGTVMLTISGLSFVGVGLDSETAEWGTMLHEAQRVLVSHPWEMAVPAMCIISACFCAFQLSDLIKEKQKETHSC
jgi:nickel transport system permease protein